MLVCSKQRFLENEDICILYMLNKEWNETVFPIIFSYWYAEQLLSRAITFALRTKTEWISSFGVKVIFISETTQVKEAVNCVKQLKCEQQCFSWKKTRFQWLYVEYIWRSSYDCIICSSPHSDRFSFRRTMSIQHPLCPLHIYRRDNEKGREWNKRRLDELI